MGLSIARDVGLYLALEGIYYLGVSHASVETLNLVAIHRHEAFLRLDVLIGLLV